MIATGRPLRFLAVVIGGWTGARAFVLWSSQIAPALVHAVAPAALAEIPAVASAPKRAAEWAKSVPLFTPSPSPATPVSTEMSAAEPPGAAVVERTLAASIKPTAAPIAFDLALPPDPLPPGVDPPPVFRASRWSGSAWAILRPDGRATPFASQLGGSQAGARLAYALGEARRVAIYARASTAIDAAEREAAVGVDWRPTRLPIHLVAERRIGVAGVRSGTAIGAVGGVGPTPIAGPIRIEGYAQGGVIFRERSESFADGSLRLTASVIPRVDLGLGSWGGAQRGAARLDMGPTVGVTLPVAHQALRLSVDWRERVAGDARPGSGPAMSLGVDF